MNLLYCSNNFQQLLNLLCLSKTDAWLMQDGQKAVWSRKQNFIAYCSSKVSSCPDCIFEIHQLWQSGFSRVYSNCCCSCSFEPEIIKIGQSFHNIYRNNIVNFQESMTILNACTKRVWKLIECNTYIYILTCTHTHTHIYIYIYIYMYNAAQNSCSFFLFKYPLHSYNLYLLYANLLP